MIITSALAQQIVDNIMPIAQHNINIMDSQGIIIGSGQKQRLNTFHRGAQDAIHSAKTIEIYPNELDQYSGSYPGLNMPIILNDQIIGVVGITGQPDEVRNIARMVKMVTELILEQETLLEEARSQYQLKENFITSLLSDNSTASHDKLLKTAKLLKYDLSLPRLVLVIDIQSILELAFNSFGHNELVTSRTRENIVQLVSTQPHINQNDLVVSIDDKLIILKHFPLETPVENFSKWCNGLFNLFKSNNYGLIRIGLGSLSQHYASLTNSYHEAQFALNSCTSHNQISTIYDFNNLSAYLVEQISKNKNSQPIKMIKAKLDINFTRKYDMETTITSLLDNNLNISSTAKSLYIHRNTLLFRLSKLKEATGLEPCRFFTHAFLCKIIFKN